MEELDRWYDQITASPVGALLLMVLVWVSRLAFDQWDRERRARKQPKRKEKKHA